MFLRKTLRQHKKNTCFCTTNINTKKTRVFAQKLATALAIAKLAKAKLAKPKLPTITKLTKSLFGVLAPVS